MKHNLIFVIVMSLALLGMTVCFDLLARSSYSELEKRDLSPFPEFSREKLASGEFTSGVSKWFSDTEPHRDFFMNLSMTIKDLQGISSGEDNITFIASNDSPQTDGEEISPGGEPVAEEAGVQLDSSVLNAKVKIGNYGIIVAGTGASTRAMMVYGAGPTAGKCYAEAANAYKAKFGDSVNVYCMVIPMAIEYYCPTKVQSRTKSQRATADNIFANLDSCVKKVDIFDALRRHAGEDIYLRTDHHWAPLGGYYAAREFAKVAGVPFKDLSAYEQKVIHRYVGSMYGYSKDLSIKQNPEDFVYYVPTGVEYTTTYIDYHIDSTRTVRSESKPYQGKFFYSYKDGSGMAYCTFMGGDTKITKVCTSTKNGRHLIILKDSFGNALPSNLFYSFEEIHVIDTRYFTKSMTRYVKENKITDILFANNISMAVSPVYKQWYMRFLQR